VHSWIVSVGNTRYGLRSLIAITAAADLALRADGLLLRWCGALVGSVAARSDRSKLEGGAQVVAVSEAWARTRRPSFMIGRGEATTSASITINILSQVRVSEGSGRINNHRVEYLLSTTRVEVYSSKRTRQPLANWPSFTRRPNCDVQQGGN
jgi:hypothetical protein